MYVSLGLLAFAFALIFDIASLRGPLWLKRVSGLAVPVIFIYAAVEVSCQRPRLAFPFYVGVMGWALLGLSLCLLIYSLFIEISFVQTYPGAGTGDRLVTTGTYALCRHPGVLWFSLFVVSLFLVSRSREWLAAGPIWIGADWVYSWIQDRWIFPRMFSGYADYQHRTPMFVPTRASIGQCMRTIGWAVRGRGGP